MLNKAHVIEITKVRKIAFMKARDSLVVRYSEERVNWRGGGGGQDGENLFFKASC